MKSCLAHPLIPTLSSRGGTFENPVHVGVLPGRCFFTKICTQGIMRNLGPQYQEVRWSTSPSCLIKGDVFDIPAIFSLPGGAQDFNRGMRPLRSHQRHTPCLSILRCRGTCLQIVHLNVVTASQLGLDSPASRRPIFLCQVGDSIDDYQSQREDVTFSRSIISKVIMGRMELNKR
ncbi:hypothetical protein PISMIDRAFT_550927 [Pisolithus microcarpus 441]|uniref:Uncharacterized protein n=1 Tax=Pisolithus microcarpus 441 TaxID=765257 RepID=A0A0C9YUL0_9AGAM|nr:hypothetical protein PISMIDRAFT_550927 [Pisolithus microcarpus 441]